MHTHFRYRRLLTNHHKNKCSDLSSIVTLVKNKKQTRNNRNKPEKWHTGQPQRVTHTSVITKPGTSVTSKKNYALEKVLLKSKRPPGWCWPRWARTRSWVYPLQPTSTQGPLPTRLGLTPISLSRTAVHGPSETVSPKAFYSLWAFSSHIKTSACTQVTRSDIYGIIPGTAMYRGRPAHNLSATRNMTMTLKQFDKNKIAMGDDRQERGR